MRMDGEIDAETFQVKKPPIEKEIKKLDKQLKKLTNRTLCWHKTVNEKLTFAETAQQRFDTDDPEVKRQLISELGSNFILKDQKVMIDLEKTFEVLKNRSNWSETYKDWLEPHEYTDILTKYPSLRPTNPNWLPDLDSNQEPTAYKKSLIFIRAWTISSPLPKR